MTTFADAVKEQGYRRIRFVTHIEWALEDRPGVDGLLEYEASANLVPFEDPVVCAYGLGKFGGDVVVEIMRTYPVIIIGGILQENPFFPRASLPCREKDLSAGRQRAASRFGLRARGVAGVPPGLGKFALHSRLLGRSRPRRPGRRPPAPERVARKLAIADPP